MKKIKEILKKYYVLIIIFILCLGSLIGGIVYFHYNLYVKPYDVKAINLKKAKKLMIVAHPDDDTIWGGDHLLKDDYLVVCVTCGAVKSRVPEFANVMHATNDQFLMLGYPDKTNGERDSWDDHRANIKKDLKEIIELKDWEIIVTHNPEGEYGHQHHKMTSDLVTQVVKEEKLDNLYYFGIYHSKKKIGAYLDKMIPMSEQDLIEKNKVIGLYKTQKFIQKTFDHMFPYENWVKADSWGEERHEDKTK